MRVKRVGGGLWDLLEEEGDMMDLLDLAQLVGQPVEALVEAISLDGAGGLDVPLKQNGESVHRVPR